MIPLVPIVVGVVVATLLSAADRPKRRARLPQARPPALASRQVAQDPAAAPAESAPAQSAPTDSPAEDRRIRRDLTLSASGLAVAAVSGTIAAPFGWLAAPLLAVPMLPYLKDGYRALVEERRLRMAVVDCLMFAGFVAAGQWIALGVGITMLSVARLMLRRAEDRSQARVVDIFGSHGKTVWVLVDGLEIEIPFAKLAQGDVLVVGAGETIAADGIVVDGTGAVDQRVLTGEARPVEKGNGDAVYAATTVLVGKLRIQVERSGEATTAGQIVAALNRTVDYRRQLLWRWMKTVDLMALPTLASGLAAWAFLGPVAALATVYSVGGFGYAMRLIAPFVLFNALRQATTATILVKDGRVFEQLQMIDTVIFDKTGTLTEDRPQVGAVHGFGGIATDRVLALAASLERRQHHPIALAIMTAAADRNLTLLEVEDTRYAFGLGLQGRIEDQDVAVGSARFLEMAGIPLPASAVAASAAGHAAGHSLVWVTSGSTVIGAIELQPTIRPEALQVIGRLRRQGRSVLILSGDHNQPTRHLARYLAVDGYFAEVMPEGKAALVRSLQREGRRVCFVGDGVNDSLALRQADVSISIRGATTVATDTAQVVLMDQTLATLPTLFDLAQQFRQRMAQGMVISGIPLAAGVGGVLFLHVGLVPVVLLYYAGVGLGIAHAHAHGPLPLPGPPRPAGPPAPGAIRPRSGGAPPRSMAPGAPAEA